ncbi:MAG: MOSC domain-containing protein [Gammaproteobacteria bacterium]|nr:MOSC domain-containing protein [Gammaproteobacteria bacterium]MYB35794.1 MOSC domain-containing protein [Gammaproteobacteria bacterium]
MPAHCTVTALFAYPMKGCRAMPVESATISPAGIEGDRQLMVLKGGKSANQARLPKLATVTAQRIDATTLAFNSQERQPLTHAVTSSGEETTVNYYGNQVPVVDQGDELAEWFSSVVGTEVRVAALKASYRRSIPLDEFAPIDGIAHSGFVDVAPILVTNEASLDDLNGRLDAPVPMNRFRPNIVVEGLGAYAEDSLATLHGPDLRLVRTTHCERCVVTCTDQETGERASEPLATLKSYRHRQNGYAGGVMFGAYMGVEGTATIHVGDRLTVGH